MESDIISGEIAVNAQVVGRGREIMVKKSFLWVVFFVFVFLASGCTLVKGVTCAGGGFAEGVKEGAKEDYNSIQKADAWIKDKLW